MPLPPMWERHMPGVYPAVPLPPPPPSSEPPRVERELDPEPLGEPPNDSAGSED